MKICPKCKRQYESGNFCENCENEDGSPVKLEEEQISCSSCGTKCKPGTKFCPECGTRLDGKANSNAVGSGFSMGDKNVIAGDVVGNKDETNITGNATIIKNEDETKKIARCHVCGSIVLRIEGYDCPLCGQFTCKDCYVPEVSMCKKCHSSSGKQKEDVYKQAVKRVLDDGKVDINERQELTSLQQQLGLSSTRALELENIVKSEISSKNINQIGNFDKITLDKAKNVLYDEFNFNKAINMLEPLCMKYSSNEEILTDYLFALSNVNPRQAKNIIKSIQADVLCLYLTQIDIAVNENNYSLVEELIAKAEKLWPDEILLKCRKTELYLKFAELSGDTSYLNQATRILDSCGKPNNKLERTWLLQENRNLYKIFNKTLPEIKELDYSKQDVYKGFFNKKNAKINEIVFNDNSGKCIVAVSSSYGISDMIKFKASHPELDIDLFIFYTDAIAISRYKDYLDDDSEKKVFIAAVIGERLELSLLEISDGVFEVNYVDSMRIKNGNVVKEIEQYIKTKKIEQQFEEKIDYEEIKKVIDEMILCTDLPISLDFIDLGERYIKCKTVSLQAITEGLELRRKVRTGELKDILLLNVYSNTIAIKGIDRTYKKLIPKWTTIPTKKNLTLSVKNIKEHFTPLEIVEYADFSDLKNKSDISEKTLFTFDNILNGEKDDSEFEITTEIDPDYCPCITIASGIEKNVIARNKLSYKK